MRMAFFAARPMIMIMPICMYTLFKKPVAFPPVMDARVRIMYSENTAPKMPVGTVKRTAKGMDQLS